MHRIIGISTIARSPFGSAGIIFNEFTDKGIKSPPFGADLAVEIKILRSDFYA